MHFLIKKQSEYKFSDSILKDYGCYRISKYLEIHSNGDVSICCYSWLPIFCGNLLTDSIDEIINNQKRIELIQNMDSGNFAECNDNCPYLNYLLNENKNSPGYIVPLKYLKTFKQNLPIEINFSYDQSCNLQCPSCRNNLILYKNNENETLNKVHDSVRKLVDYLLDQGEKLILNITGSGDAFASPTFFNYLKELKANDNLQLKLSTNGLLMTDDRLKEISHLWNNIYQINISIDAATAATYNIVRKNGSFEKITQNLLDLNNKIKNESFKNLKLFQTNFTVQKNNYKEILDFAKWQLSHDQLTFVYFNLIVQWGHINTIDFNNKFLLSEVEKLELKELLQDPIFMNRKVNLGNLNSIKNYEPK